MIMFLSVREVDVTSVTPQSSEQAGVEATLEIWIQVEPGLNLGHAKAFRSSCSFSPDNSSFKQLKLPPSKSLPANDSEYLTTSFENIKHVWLKQRC